MKKFSQKNIAEYLYRNFSSVDGLWFVKVEEQFGFEKALEIDKEVWKVLPKIQARFIKSCLSPGIAPENITSPASNSRSEVFSPEDLFIKALKIKLKIDHFRYRIFSGPGFIKVRITHCPWHEIMVRSGRENLSAKVGSSICMTEYSVFASEFFKDMHFDITEKICNSAGSCIFYFKKQNKPQLKKG